MFTGGGLPDGWAPPPEPTLLAPADDEIPPLLRRALELEGRRYVALRRRAFQQWGELARIFAQVRAMGVSEEALAAFAAELGVDLPSE